MLVFPDTDVYDPDGSEELLVCLTKPETNVNFASEYYEKTSDINVVRKIYAHDPLRRLWSPN